MCGRVPLLLMVGTSCEPCSTPQAALMVNERTPFSISGFERTVQESEFGLTQQRAYRQYEFLGSMPTQHCIHGAR